MIARIWRGRVPAVKGADYLYLMETVALADYRSIPGNLGAWCLSRAEETLLIVEMFSLWEDMEAIRRFAGSDVDAARYYDFDPDFLIELDPRVTHFEAIGGPSVSAAT